MWPFVVKEFYHIFRDYRSMLILFGMPVIQVLLFGFAINNDIKDARIAILDKSKDVVTNEIKQKILSSGYFILEKNINREEEMKELFKAGRIKEVIVFEPDFANILQTEGSAAIQLVLDASEPNTANLLNAYTSGIVNSYVLQKMQHNFTRPLTIQTESKMLYNPEMRGVYMFVPGVITILLMLVSAMMTSISITREKETGTMEALLVSPLAPYQIILGKVSPYVLLSVINLTSILLLAKFVFLMPFHGSLILLTAECILFTIMALALGILISTVSKSQQQAMMLSMFALMLPTILLSGFIFPIENMPLPLQYLSNIMPPRWFIIIVKSIMLKGAGIAYIWKETLIIIGMALFFIAVSIRKFKIRLQ